MKLLLLCLVVSDAESAKTRRVNRQMKSDVLRASDPRIEGTRAGRKRLEQEEAQ